MGKRMGFGSVGIRMDNFPGKKFGRMGKRMESILVGWKMDNFAGKKFGRMGKKYIVR